MDIALCYESVLPARGGAETYLGDLARRLARELHRRKVFHKDLYFCHFYIPDDLTRRVPDDWTNRAVMIDLHRLGRHPVAAAWWRTKDLAQLLYSSEVPGVTARDRVRFWKLYRQGWPGDRPPGDWLRRLVAWKAARYHRREQRKPSAVPYDQQRSAA